MASPPPDLVDGVVVVVQLGEEVGVVAVGQGSLHLDHLAGNLGGSKIWKKKKKR